MTTAYAGPATGTGDFIELSTCQVVAGATNIQELLERTDQAQEDLNAGIDEGVNRAKATVAKLV